MVDLEAQELAAGIVLAACWLLDRGEPNDDVRVSRSTRRLAVTRERGGSAVAARPRGRRWTHESMFVRGEPIVTNRGRLTVQSHK